MRARSFIVLCLVVSGCYPEEMLGGGPDGGPVRADAGVPDAGPMTPADGGEGLPCDVEAVIAQNCRSCHKTMPAGGAPMPLLSRQHFLNGTPSNAAVTTGAMSVTRMQNPAAPMPPSGQLSAAQISTVANWVNAGMPVGSCSTTDAGPDPFDVPPQCTSGTTWNGGNEGSARMNPGMACLTCHRQENDDEDEEEAPEGIGGTVYPTAHEPNRCNGLPGGAVVVIRGADGREFRLTVNTSGNFHMYSTSQLVRPFTARVEYQGRVRAMGTPQTDGDCNSCHTQAGANGAPGRIVAP